eukprot:9907277-Prorocentrum_lima.AAC.1
MQHAHNDGQCNDVHTARRCTGAWQRASHNCVHAHCTMKGPGTFLMDNAAWRAQMMCVHHHMHACAHKSGS